MNENTGTEKTDEDSLYIEREIIADPGQELLRIDKFLMDRVANVSRTRIQNSLNAEAIKVNGKKVKPNYKVRPLDKIVLIIPKDIGKSEELIPEDIPLDIRYEDEYLMVIHKPAGLVVHPGTGNKSGTLVNGLKFYLDKKDIPVMAGNSLDRPGLVHRIDKDTSGLLVIAKEEFTMTHLGKQFFDHSIERTYQALVWGDIDAGEHTIQGNIGRHPRFRNKMYVFPENDEGKEATTHYSLIENMYYVSLIECRLETGRTHQIRVHMQSLNHPIFNDVKYGGDKIIKGTVFSKYKQFVFNTFKVMPRQALHAKTLAFIHPHTKEKMRFDTELPEEFQAVLARWRNYLSTRKRNEL